MASIVAGCAAVLGHGAESWHPNPEFFYKPGGGPILDMGPYYVTQLVNLLGPVLRVSAAASSGSATRTITSEPLKGQTIQVEVPTTVNGALEFANGANITMTASWDVWANKRSFIEIYGTEGSLLGVNPNFFGDTPMVTAQGGDWQAVDIAGHPFAAPNRALRSGAQVADYRIVGVVDMAMAIRTGRAHRASGELALHVLEVLEAFELSSRLGQHVRIQSCCARPEAVPLGIGEEVFL